MSRPNCPSVLTLIFIVAYCKSAVVAARLEAVVSIVPLLHGERWEFRMGIGEASAGEVWPYYNCFLIAAMERESKAGPLAMLDPCRQDFRWGRKSRTIGRAGQGITEAWRIW